MLSRSLSRLSAVIASIEKVLLMLLVLMIFVFVLMNVVLRVFGITIAWADEVAVYSMIISGFLGASLMLRARIDPAVLLVYELASARVIRALRTAVSLATAVFGVSLCYFCWLWFDPLALAAAGFDIPAFEGATFNFTYTDTTPVMGVPLFYIYLIMPWFALAITIHAVTNLAEDMGFVARPEGLLSDLQAGE
ncbi:TRAP transporter small permease [Roseobacter denitrificans]|uniref:TRAP transporter small permease protein n=1 Tax=Roseobacter denitrificans (strain ATCC 33942 / OCh 114) TaxID=375451 RepID=Q16A22_ROSDO|nr:TRAP transporter small permease [Roseobacter denitrificans]ABG31171.1 ABC transporte, permease protein, putative [Roseobacter denitrificans OCh 114]AVL54231.1 TRAP transporter small permease [Roseobacter denitrificans]SFG31971.1 TRAP-type C4-dicarboxylate transport system, small permease component [Roseobacter denitrificans OCh 114]